VSNVVSTKPLSLDEVLEKAGGEKTADQPVEKKTGLSDDLKSKLRSSNEAEKDAEEADITVATSPGVNKELNLLLTSMKVWTPMISAIASSSHDLSIEDAMVSLKELIEACSDISTHISGEFAKSEISLASESNRWVMRQILSNVSVTLSKQYLQKQSLELDLVKELYSSLFGVISGKVSDTFPEENRPLMEELTQKSREKYMELKELLYADSNERLNIDNDSAIACSLLKAMEPVTTQLARFSWFAESMLVSQKCAEHVISGAGFLYESTLKDTRVLPGSKGAVMYMQSCLDKAGNLFAAAYSSEARLSLSEIQAFAGDEQRNRALKLKVAGVPFDAINERFEKNLGLQSSLTKSGAEYLRANLGRYLNDAKKPDNAGDEQRVKNVP
tara:strand:- start:941 stop:2104 length:1164 start_codon:yes stop_codon:yes gene_type:complete